MRIVSSTLVKAATKPKDVAPFAADAFKKAGFSKVEIKKRHFDEMSIVAEDEGTSTWFAVVISTDQKGKLIYGVDSETPGAVAGIDLDGSPFPEDGATVLKSIQTSIKKLKDSPALKAWKQLESAFGSIIKKK